MTQNKPLELVIYNPSGFPICRLAALRCCGLELLIFFFHCQLFYCCSCSIPLPFLWRAFMLSFLSDLCEPPQTQLLFGWLNFDPLPYRWTIKNDHLKHFLQMTAYPIFAISAITIICCTNFSFFSTFTIPLIVSMASANIFSISLFF